MTQPTTQTSAIAPHLYDRDFYEWIATTAKLLRDRSFEDLDLDNLIEEIEAMGRKEKSALKSNLIIVLLHLLKYQYQPQRRTNSWLLSIYEHRRRVRESIEESPSLKPYCREVFENCYGHARQEAAIETGLKIDIFPDRPPFTLEEALDFNYLEASR